MCITKSWLTSSSSAALKLYSVSGYLSFFDVRSGKESSGILILTNELICRQVTFGTTANNAFNVCGVATGNDSKQVLVMSVYRSPWASVADTKTLYQTLDGIAVKFKKIIILGEFNLPAFTKFKYAVDNEQELLRNLFSEHGLRKIVSAPSRGEPLLDLIFVSPHFTDSDVMSLLSVAGSDHNA